MHDRHRICIDEIPFFRQPHFFQITGAVSFYPRYAPFTPAHQNIVRLCLPVPAYKCFRTQIPLPVYFKHGNHRIPAGGIDIIKRFHLLAVFHIDIV